MEKKQGFFSALKEEVVRGLSPARTRSKSPARSASPMAALLRRKKSSGGGGGGGGSSSSSYVANTDALIARSGSMRPLGGETLTPLIEGPDPDGGEIGGSKRVGLGQWMKVQLSRAPSVTSNGYGNNQQQGINNSNYPNNNNKRSDLRLLLGVMGAPLAPVHVSAMDPLPHLSIKDTPIETSSAQYILQQYTAASGGQKVQNSIRNAYAMGKLKMVASEFETATKVVKNRNAARAAESGGFVLWQMNPDMWYVELAVGGSKVHAGCNGKLVWRHTPWLGAHTAKGPVRPLRRALQGLDPRTTASMFADARCIGEKKINGEDCFILKLCADPQTLKARSEGPAEIIRHVLFGYFSQKTGLLVHMEDSHLTRIQTNGGDAVYWETTINSFLEDYHPVEGIMIAHSGRSVVTLFRFGEMAMSHTKTRMEEAWTIEEVAFNVPGLSLDCFIPPADLRSGTVSEACELPADEKAKNALVLAAHRAKVVALEKTHGSNVDNVFWKVEI
ncbi:OLC1v1002965C1 [Oldenlandia corymbosa var. corymbosa]|uniref:OLC1v1002965C1 n=1 Tax=Oldenlandia corymbosa var. corymbosa TaxID=529605 RepID=A0AAV1D8Y8_OLDCO|nr:OLC1v1002965C1 [Oldenlandia corymbosa var. corymbosa]